MWHSRHLIALGAPYPWCRKEPYRSPMTDVISTPDLEYAVVDGYPLLLDLHRPADPPGPVPVVLYLHGGGWAAGSKSADEPRLIDLARRGVAVASADYRLVDRATHPAQLHDAKAAVRWLRANGGAYGLRTGDIGIWGASAGAHIAGLAALTCGDPESEGRVGDHLDQSSAVQAAVSWFGPADLLHAGRSTSLERRILGTPGVEALLDGPVDGDPDKARAASPAYRAHAAAPPFLIVHGDADRMVSEQQSRFLHDALTRAGASPIMTILGGAGHEGEEFDSPANLAMTVAFLATHLRK